MRVIGLAGWSGAGKTTLMVRLVPELVRRGLSVSTLKHAHSGFEIDVPGKDSFEHRQAGATEVLVASARRVALVQELRGAPEPPLRILIARLSPVDFAIVEGFKRERHPKIAVHRAGNGKDPIWREVGGIVAIASDEALAGETLPVVHLDDIAAIADIAIRYAVPVESAFGRPETV